MAEKHQCPGQAYLPQMKYSIWKKKKKMNKQE